MQIAQDDEKNDVWKQLLSLQLPPQKEVLDCVETICQSGEAKEKEQEEKNAQEEKRADAIQIELKNRQNTNHLFELLKKTGEQLEILKGAGEQSGRNAKTDPCSNSCREGGCSRRTIAEKTKGECANLKKESRELEEKTETARQRIWKRRCVVSGKRGTFQKKKSRRSRNRSSGSRKYFRN